MDAIADACGRGEMGARIGIVLSDVARAGILERARIRGLDARHVSPGRYRTKLDEESESAFIQALRDARVDLVVLAGFMRVLKGDFLRAFSGRVVNIHPSLLPSFPGLDAWKQALEYGVKVSGCTVHLVDQGIDTGPILAQRAVPIVDGDTPESLHARIQDAEHDLYPNVIGGLLRNEFHVRGRIVTRLKAG